MRPPRIAAASATKPDIESGVRGSDPARLRCTTAIAAWGTQSRKQVPVDFHSRMFSRGESFRPIPLSTQLLSHHAELFRRPAWTLPSARCRGTLD